MCPACGDRHTRRPNVGVAVLLIEEGRILLGRRSAGGWCIPCGHVEWGESIEEAARREFLEETGLVVELGPIRAVHSNFHQPDHLTVGIWFDGRRSSGTLRAGDDLVDVQFFSPADLPELCFPTDGLVLRERISSTFAEKS
jgi:ADP-ribose pyrophosphatase YjhB (NUDIX family)